MVPFLCIDKGFGPAEIQVLGEGMSVIHRQPLTGDGARRVGRWLRDNGHRKWSYSSSIDFPHEYKTSFREDVRGLVEEGYKSMSVDNFVAKYTPQKLSDSQVDSWGLLCAQAARLSIMLLLKDGEPQTAVTGPDPKNPDLVAFEESAMWADVCDRFPDDADWGRIHQAMYRHYKTLYCGD